MLILNNHDIISKSSWALRSWKFQVLYKMHLLFNNYVHLLHYWRFSRYQSFFWFWVSVVAFGCSGERRPLSTSETTCWFEFCLGVLLDEGGRLVGTEQLLWASLKMAEGSDHFTNRLHIKPALKHLGVIYQCPLQRPILRPPFKTPFLEIRPPYL